MWNIQSVSFPRCLVATVATSAFFSIPTFASAEGGSAIGQVDSLMQLYVRQSAIPSLTYAIVQDGKVVHARSFGYSDLENRVSATRASRYEIGSMTKQFTAAGIFLLQQEGKLSIEDRLDKHLKNLPDAWKSLTIHQCLSHTAGLKDYLATFSALRTDPVATDEIIKRMGTMALDFTPGSAWSYSNTGYLLMSQVIEAKSGQKYPQFLTERFFKPLGMTSTSTSDPDTVIPNRARPYAWTGKGYTNRPVINPSLAKGAGELVSTVDDLTKWANELDHPKILKPESVAAMQTAFVFNNGRKAGYGTGFFLHRDRGREIIEHGGNTTGMSSEIFRVPSKNLTMIVLTNSAGLAPAQACRQALGVLDPSWNPLLRAETDPNERRSLELMVTFRKWARGNFDNSAFSPEMMSMLNTTRGLAVRQAFQIFGKMAKTYRYLDGEDYDGHRFDRYAMQIGAVEVPLEFEFDANGKVVSMEQIHAPVLKVSTRKQ
jgi:CubicO group peptidase (beta-lactamase class C family)